jgi:hypothetical protein
MKLAKFFASVVVCLVFSFTVSGQFFTLPGTFFYSLNSVRQVFDVSPDGKIGIALRNDPAATHPALLTTFDPVLGTQLDSKIFGFGPLAVQLAQVGNNLRAVVLTSEGGPRRIYLFDVSPTGQLTQLGSTQLTASVGDGGSNLVLSGSAQVGFTIVYSNSGGAELVSFSLVDGAILNRLPQTDVSATLAMNEAANNRRLVFRIGNSLKVVNALNPAQLINAGSVTLVSNGEFSAAIEDGIAFSTDGRYVFLGNQFYNFAAIDLSILQVVGTIPGNYRFGRVAIFEDNQRRLLAIHSTPSGTGAGVRAILLVDATDPTHLSIVNQHNFPTSDGLSYKGDSAFSHDGLRLYTVASDRLIAFDLPGFTRAWEQPVPGPDTREQQIKVYGPTDEVLGAWQMSNGFGFTSVFGAFPAFPPDISVSESASASESSAGVNFTVALSSSTTHRVSVNYAALDGTAQKQLDFTDTVGTVTFDPGVTTKVVSVPIINDNRDEFDETFPFVISNPTVGRISQSQSIGTIIDDDPPPSLSIGDVTSGEGNTGISTANFPVFLSTPSGKPITVQFTALGNTATGDIDYFSVKGTVSLFAGQSVSQAVVFIKPDTLNEDDETFFVDLSNPLNATLSDARAMAVILDDDHPVLATEQNSQRAIALDLLTLVREPFPANNVNYFGTPQRSRISLFSTNISLTPGLVVTAQGEDAQGMVFQLPVEFVGSVPSLAETTQLVVRLPDGIQSAGDLRVRLTVRGRPGNSVLVAVSP